MITTGFRRFDELMGGGLVPGTLSLLAAHTGCGKSTMALNIFHNAGPHPLPRLYISLDLPLCIVEERLKNYELDPLAEIVVRAQADLAELRGLIEDAVEWRGVKLVVLDGLSQITGPGRVATQRINMVARQLKVLAMELDVALVATTNIRYRLRDAMPAFEEEAGNILYWKKREKHQEVKDPFHLPFELIFRKNLRGPTGEDSRTSLIFERKRHRFVEVMG